jgi:hypothetical protein
MSSQIFNDFSKYIFIAGRANLSEMFFYNHECQMKIRNSKNDCHDLHCIFRGSVDNKNDFFPLLKT